MPKRFKTKKKIASRRHKKSAAYKLSRATAPLDSLGISVDEIAERVGIEKRIYTKFRDKLHLLAQASVRKYAVIADTLQNTADASPQEVLRAVAENYYACALDEEYIRLMSSLLGEEEDLHPIYNAGPHQNIRELALYFERATLRGEMDVSAPFLMAEIFFGALKGYIRERYWFRHTPPPTNAERQARIGYLIELFIKGHTR